jgi:hypothetical protein
MQVMESKRSTQITLESQRKNDLAYLKLQWVSAKDEGLKKELSEKIMKRLTLAN